MYRLLTKKLLMTLVFLLLSLCGGMVVSATINTVQAQYACPASCPCGCDGTGNCNWSACGAITPGTNTDIRAKAYIIDSLGNQWTSTCESPYTGLSIEGITANIVTGSENCVPGDNHFTLKTRAIEGLVVRYLLVTIPSCSVVTWELLDADVGNAVVRSGTGCVGDLIISNKNKQYRYTLIYHIPALGIPPTCGGIPLLTAPKNVRSACNPLTAGKIQLQWDEDINATYYSLRIDSSKDNFNWQPGGPCPAATTGPGDHCIDIPAGTTSYEFDADPTATYTWWIHSRDGCNIWGTPVYGPAMKCTPNCSNIFGPSSLIVGETGTYSAFFESLNKNLVGQIYRGNFASIGSIDFTDINGSFSSDWVPGVGDVGPQQICCRAFNDSLAECRPPSQVDFPPRYACEGTNGLGATTCMNVQVNLPTPWYKLRDASFHRNGPLNITIPSNMDKFDGADDTDDQYPMIGHAGVLSTTENTLTVNSLSGDVSAFRWRATNFADQNSFLDNIDAFIAYARARKNVNLITGLADIQPNVINILQGDVTIADYNELPTRVRNSGYILIVNGDLTFGWVPPEININQHGVAFIATGKINIDSRYTEVNGILIAQSIDLASDVVPPNTATNPLKINGNLISRTAIDTNKRARTDTNRPSLFVVFKPQMYAELLPLLSTITQEGRQIE